MEMEIQTVNKDIDDQLKKYYELLGINDEIFVTVRKNQSGSFITTRGIVNGIMEHINNYYNKKVSEIEKEYGEKKSKSNSYVWSILEIRQKMAIENIKREYKDITKICLLYGELMNLFEFAYDKIQSIEKEMPNLGRIEILLNNIDKSNQQKLFTSLQRDMDFSSFVDFNEIDDKINEIERILENTKENISFFDMSKSGARFSFKDYMDKSIGTLRAIRNTLNSKAKTTMLLTETQKGENDVKTNAKAIKPVNVDKIIEYIDSQKINVSISSNIRNNLIEYDITSQVVDLIMECKNDYRECKNVSANLEDLYKIYFDKKTKLESSLNKDLNKLGFDDINSFINKCNEYVDDFDKNEAKKRSMEIFKAEYLKGRKTRQDFDKFVQEINLSLSESEAFLTEIESAQATQSLVNSVGKIQKYVEEDKRIKLNEEVEKLAQEIYAAKLRTFRYDEDPEYSRRDMQNPGYEKALKELYEESIKEAQNRIEQKEAKKEPQKENLENVNESQIRLIKSLTEPYQTPERTILYQEYCRKNPVPNLRTYSFAEYLKLVHANPSLIARETAREEFAQELYSQYLVECPDASFDEYQRMIFKNNGIMTPLEFDAPIMSQISEERRRSI